MMAINQNQVKGRVNVVQETVKQVAGKLVGSKRPQAKAQCGSAVRSCPHDVKRHPELTPTAIPTID
jgi:hypothetical protein